MRDLIAAAVFYILSVLLFPITLVGYVIWVGKGILTRRGSGVSGTAQGPLSARFFMHKLGTRQDEPANRLMMVLPGVPRLGLRLVAGPMLLAHRLTGYVPRAFRYPFEGDVPPQYEASARQSFFDTVVDRSLADIAQFVILGAGFDTRAFRLPKGSVIAFDYFTTEPLESQALYWRYARAGTRAAGEPLKFGIDSTPPSSERLAELLQTCGLSLGEQRTLGQETEDKRAWGGFATVIVKRVS